MVFAAFAAPEVLCTDRRSGMLGLYLASPLDRDTYLVAKAAAVGVVLSLVTLGPPLFMLVARTVAGVGPDGFTAFLGVLWRVVVGGVLVAALPGALSLAIASTTTRTGRGVGRVHPGRRSDRRSSPRRSSTPERRRRCSWLNLPYLPLELVGRLYGEPPGFISTTATNTSTAALVIAYVVITLGCAVFVRFRYQSIRVSR